ncbi:MAG: hypothetical protein AABM40_03145 [Chloroflexota bacterium]
MDDLDAQGRNAWNARVKGYFRGAHNGDPEKNDGPRTAFYDPTETPTAADAKTLAVDWFAFPKQVRLQHPVERERWTVADQSRDNQDEYCEWSVEFDQAKVRKITFTCEAPEYWELLAELAPEKVVKIYQDHVNEQVRKEHLFRDGEYIPRNRWNRDTRNGAMHLIQPSNTLGAEINLAAGASIVRRENGRIKDGSSELIECSLYGEENRNSDPHIGEVVNELARRDADITLENPVGLYFGGLFPVDWEVPDGQDPKTFWRYTRGDATHPVRAVFEVPPGRGFVVGDIKIGGVPIQTGGQIADFIKIKLTAVACRFGESSAGPVDGCVGRGGPVALDEATSLPSRRLRA